jgi:hypothetical protein
MNHFEELIYEILDKLLDYGANPNQFDFQGMHPLAFFASYSSSNEGLVSLLLQHDADPNIESIQINDDMEDVGNTALHSVLYVAEGNANWDGIIIELLEGGANVDLANNDGVTPRQLFFETNQQRIAQHLNGEIPEDDSFNEIYVYFNVDAQEHVLNIMPNIATLPNLGPLNINRSNIGWTDPIIVEPINTGDEIIRINNGESIFIFARLGLEQWLATQMNQYPNRLPTNPLTREPIGNENIELYTANVNEDAGLNPNMSGGLRKKKRTSRKIATRKSKITRKHVTKNKTKSKSKKQLHNKTKSKSRK